MRAEQTTQWLTWQDAFTPHERLGGTIHLVDRILRIAEHSDQRDNRLEHALAEAVGEFSARWGMIRQRSPDWQTLASWGRLPRGWAGDAEAGEVLDREAAGLFPVGAGRRESQFIAPLFIATMLPGDRSVLVLGGELISAESLPEFLVVARALGHARALIDQHDQAARRADRLAVTLELAGRFARTRESEPLLELIASEATRLLECDRASIFIWDRARQEVVARPALGLEDLRFPEDVGLVGEVLRSGRPTRVNETSDDQRFAQEVDDRTGYQTRNLLAVPLRGGDGEIVGVFEAMNKQIGGFTEDDEQSLSLLGDQAALALENVVERENLIRSQTQLAARVTEGVRLIGESPAIQALRATVHRLAATDLPVLLLGESGTGKEVVAQSLHFLGPRANHPFVAVNCAALTETLLESELFGHEAGAFTDAREARRGKFELAEGGTLFLDEIGDMSAAGQAKLLRVLEQKVVTRVGGSRPIPVDVRIIAATNANLRELVRQNVFREDLYYRLGVVTQPLPPLRERPEDILPLAEHFLGQFRAQARRNRLTLSPDARRRLQAHAWPGNIRELRNLMERLAFLAPGERIEPEDLQFMLSPDREGALEPDFDLGLTEATKEFQREFIGRAVRRVKGNMSDAAKLLGLHRSNLYRKMRQLDIEE